MINANIYMNVGGYDLLDKSWSGSFSGTKEFNSSADLIDYIECAAYWLKEMFNTCDVTYTINHECGTNFITVNIMLQEREIATF